MTHVPLVEWDTQLGVKGGNSTGGAAGYKPLTCNLSLVNDNCNCLSLQLPAMICEPVFLDFPHLDNMSVLMSVLV